MAISIFKRTAIFLFAIFFYGCSGISKVPKADVIYLGGDIITMNDAQASAEAVAVKDGKILSVGSKKSVLVFKGNSTKIIDLKGRTLLPGFIDAHSHLLMSFIYLKAANVSPAPIGPVTDIPSLKAVISDFIAKNKIPKGEWVIAWGYDNSQLSEKRHITCEDLDAVTPDNPAVVVHCSAHGAVVNSLAMAKWGISEKTLTPAGGTIGRFPGTNRPTGLLMESAWFPCEEKLPQPAEDKLLPLLAQAQQLYAQNGYTTVSEGATQYDGYKLLLAAAQKGILYLDIRALPVFLDLDKYNADQNVVFGKEFNHLKLSGVKFVIDGSPQGLTAFMSEPYLVLGPNGETSWRGLDSITPDVFNKLAKEIVDRGIPVYTHCNGDAAVDIAIAGLKAAGVTVSLDRRDVVVHSQFIRPEQLDEYIKLGIFPSFFTNHAFYWGDVHIKNLGPGRAAFLSPMKSAKAKGIRFTNHTDFLVTPLNPMMPLWTAVARESKSGEIIGPDERISVMDSLKALTINGAYQYHEEDSKGSLEVNKLADMVILDRNPFKVTIQDLKGLKVMETIKEGRTVYKAD